MKKSLRASGFIGAVASLLGVVAVGCSAEQGAGPEAEIGSTSEALSVSTMADLKDAFDTDGTSNITDPVAREWAGSCVIRDGANGALKLLIVGGYDSSGNGLGDAYLYDVANDKWTKAESLPSGQERGELQMIQVPGDDTSCLAVGGATKKDGSGTALTQVYKFTAGGSGNDGTWAEAGLLNTGRVKFALTTCGTNVIAIGGEPGGGAAPNTSDEIEAWGSVTGHVSTWSSYGSKLGARIHSFGFASKDSTHKVIAGGQKASGLENRVQLIKITDSACDQASDITVTQATALSTARFGNVVLFSDQSAPLNDDFIVTAGSDASALLTDAEPYSSVNLGASPPVATKDTVLTSQITGTQYPIVMVQGTKTLFMGGGAFDNTTYLGGAPIDLVQEYSGSFSSTAFGDSKARLGSVAQTIGSLVYVSTGMTAQSSTLTTTSRIVTP